MLLVAFVLLAVAATEASAQGLGLGGRITQVRSEADPEDADAARLTGGLVRLRTSPRVGLELALDYRSTLDEDHRTRLREFPLQASALLFLTQTRLSPYLLGGVGWYSLRTEQLDAEDGVLASETTRRMGVHAGLGGEVQLSRRVSVHADYRYTFLRYGEPAADTPSAPGALPLPGTIGLQERLKLHHEGSMWNFGLTVTF